MSEATKTWERTLDAARLERRRRKLWLAISLAPLEDQRSIMRTMLLPRPDRPSYPMLAKALSSFLGTEFDTKLVHTEMTSKEPQLDWCSTWDEARTALGLTVEGGDQ